MSLGLHGCPRGSPGLHRCPQASLAIPGHPWGCLRVSLRVPRRPWGSLGVPGHPLGGVCGVPKRLQVSLGVPCCPWVPPCVAPSVPGCLQVSLGLPRWPQVSPRLPGCPLAILRCLCGVPRRLQVSPDVPRCPRGSPGCPQVSLTGHPRRPQDSLRVLGCPPVSQEVSRLSPAVPEHPRPPWDLHECPWVCWGLPPCPQGSPRVSSPRVPPTPQAAEGPLGRGPEQKEEEEEEERRRRERLAGARRLALRLAGLLGAGTSVAIVYIFGASPARPLPVPGATAGPPLTSPLPPPAGSNAVDEHGAKVRGARQRDPPVSGGRAVPVSPPCPLGTSGDIPGA